MSTSKNEIITGIISTIAGASLIGGGTMVLRNAANDGAQDVKIERIEQRLDRFDESVKQLTGAVQSLDKNVAILSERLKEQE